MLEEAGGSYERVLIDIRKGGQNNPGIPRGQSDGEGAGAGRRRGEGRGIGRHLRLCRGALPEARLAPPLGDPARGRYLQWLFFAAAGIEPAFTQKITKLESPESRPAGAASSAWWTC